MIFQPESAQAIVQMYKTQTRRPIKAGETCIERDGLKTVLTAAGRIKYQVGRTYAVQYGYGKPTCWRGWGRSNEPVILPYETYLDIIAIDDWQERLRFQNYKPLQIKLLDIYNEDVRDISESDAIAEGFDNQYGFWQTWCGFYDKPASNYLIEPDVTLDSAYKYLQMSPDEKYQAWALTFELVN